MYTIRTLRSRAVPHSPRLSQSPRFLSQVRPHPLAAKAPTPGAFKPRPQKWSSLTAILVATFTGSATYIFGLQSGMGAAKGSAPAGDASKVYKDPTAAGFAKAMQQLRTELPQDCIAEDRETLVDHGHSKWSYHDPTGLPGAVLYPRSTEDVVKIVKLAALYSIPLVPFSGGTSLEGHTDALSYASNPGDKKVMEKKARGEKVVVDDLGAGLSWCLDFSENMGRIIAVHANDLDVVVQPGVSYDALNAQLKEDGVPLFFPVDPAPGAMIGGMVGTGASGTNAGRYGTMRENVINLTVVLASGEVIKTRQRAKKCSAGPDLSKLFIGSEGTLGIVVEATLKLVPRLPTTVAVTSFPTIRLAADAVRDIVQQGVGVACVELLDDTMMKAINKKGGKYVWEEKPSLFIKFSGSEDQMKGDVERTRIITNANSGSKFTFAKDDSDAEDIWYSRKVALWSALDYIPGSRCFVTDVCVPISNLPQLIAETKVDIEAEGICGPMVSHALDGNYHALLLFSNDEEHRKVEGLVHRMVERAQRLDGTCTGEHGIGAGKLEYLQAELGESTVDLLRDIKGLLDPQNIMNPGKLIPEKGATWSHSH